MNDPAKGVIKTSTLAFAGFESDNIPKGKDNCYIKIEGYTDQHSNLLDQANWAFS
jgi:hypothetical protein